MQKDSGKEKAGRARCPGIQANCPTYWAPSMPHMCRGGQEISLSQHKLCASNCSQIPLLHLHDTCPLPSLLADPAVLPTSTGFSSLQITPLPLACLLCFSIILEALGATVEEEREGGHVCIWVVPQLAPILWHLNSRKKTSVTPADVVQPVNG